jgi:hypothetical protein
MDSSTNHVPDFVLAQLEDDNLLAKFDKFDAFVVLDDEAFEDFSTVITAYGVAHEAACSSCDSTGDCLVVGEVTVWNVSFQNDDNGTIEVVNAGDTQREATLWCTECWDGASFEWLAENLDA